MVWGYLGNVKDGLARGQTFDDALNSAMPPLFAAAQEPQNPAPDLMPMDEAAGIKARERAIKTVSKGASQEWRDKALAGVKKLCELRLEFLSEDVWQHIREKPDEPRALGAVMRRAEAAGYCIKTDRFLPSKIVANHRAPKRVWRSLIQQ